MEKISLAVCIPTYNRPEVIKEFIETAAPRYIEHGFSIFIYDSSEGTQTEGVVAGWLQQYGELHYVRVDPTIHSNMKVYNIFEEFGKSGLYEYLWVCSDSIRWSERVLDAVCKYAEEKYDIIVPNYRDMEKLGDRIYTDKNKFFLDCAWHMTLYGATILSTSSMLTGVDWNYLKQRYAVPECINHSHVAFYFEKLNLMDCWKALHLSFAENDLQASDLKKNPGWQDQTFYVWCHCWPAMVGKLPKDYHHKRRVIRKSGIYSKILSFVNLRALRMKEILNLDIYRLYRKDWRRLTNVPRLAIYFLAKIPSDKALYTDLDWTCWKIKREVKVQVLKGKLKRFCHKFDQIYIYGAGQKASRYTGYLEALEIPFKGYVVSELSDNQKVINGHKVLPFCANLLEDGRTGILVALNEENTMEVMRGTLADVNRKYIFSEYK